MCLILNAFIHLYEIHPNSSSYIKRKKKIWKWKRRKSTILFNDKSLNSSSQRDTQRHRFRVPYLSQSPHRSSSFHVHSSPIVQNSEESQFRANESEEIESAKMGVDDLPMDDKAKRMRDLLSSFYSPDPSISPDSDSPSSRPQQITLDDINSTSFDPDHYMNFLVRRPIFFNFDSIWSKPLKSHCDLAAYLNSI